MEFTNLKDFLARLEELPIGAIRALATIDIDAILKSRLEIAEKDKAKILGFFPAVIEKIADIGLVVGFELGLKQALNGQVDDAVVAKGEGFDVLIKEALAVVECFYDQGRHLTSDGFDPFNEEREIARIFAKRNSLNPAYLELLGVSEETPSEFPQWFVDKFM